MFSRQTYQGIGSTELVNDYIPPTRFPIIREENTLSPFLLQVQHDHGSSHLDLPGNRDPGARHRAGSGPCGQYHGLLRLHYPPCPHVSKTYQQGRYSLSSHSWNQSNLTSSSSFWCKVLIYPEGKIIVKVNNLWIHAYLDKKRDENHYSSNIAGHDWATCGSWSPGNWGVHTAIGYLC